VTSPLTPSKAARLYWLGRYVQRTLQVPEQHPALLDPAAEGSLRFNLVRAYENGFLLRDLLDNEVFAYLRLALTKAETLPPGQHLGLREVRDSLYAFWGILDEALSPEAASLVRWGRFLELWDQRTREARDDEAQAAWRELTACWNLLGLEAPRGQSLAEVQNWFGACYADQ